MDRRAPDGSACTSFDRVELASVPALLLKAASADLGQVRCLGGKE